MPRFFIDHPVFAWVISILMMLVGIIALFQLPISQYPEIAPTTIEIRATYPGASAQTVEDSVVQIIEQNLTGLDDLQYITSSSDSSGTAQISVTFQATTDPDIAQVQVQNQLQSAMPLMPQEVQQQGIRVNKSSSGFLMVLGAVSPDGSMDRFDIANYVAANIQDAISRVSGVGRAQLFGSQYAMRIWLDADKLAYYQLTTEDVVNAIRTQNVQVAAGEVGGTPAVPGQEFAASIVVETRLETPEQFRQILLRVNEDGSYITIGDIARVDLGGENFQFITQYNKQPAAGIGITLASGANALDTANLVRARVAELEPFFPQGFQITYPYDTTPFIQVSIKSVTQTLLEAIVLIFVVMYLFLQNWRATLIPTITIPVVILGTFAVLLTFGYSINMLTMFAMVLAIGLLVDDAIVVVENVERLMHEEGLSPREATRRSMDQIMSALIGITLTISAVFIPMAFFAGSTGVIYRQFSITIVTAMVLSTVIALTLSPALCATLLKAPTDRHKEKRGFFGWFNRSFERTSHGYQRSVKYLINRLGRMLVIYLIIVGGLMYVFMQLPASFIPDEDQGILFTEMQLPVNASQERSVAVMKRIEDYYLKQEADGVESIFSVIGFGFSGRGQNSGLVFVNLKDWGERTDPALSSSSIAGRSMGYFGQFRDAVVFAMAPPSIPALGTATGFNLQLQDVGGLGHDNLIAARDQLLSLARQDQRLMGVRHAGMNDTPQLKIDIDHQKAAAFGVALNSINQTFATAWGSSYVNDFIDNGRIKRVYVQGDAPFRMVPEDISKWHVRNEQGDMVPMSAFSSTRWIYGSPRLERYNGISSLNIQGQGASGISSGQAMLVMEELMTQLPPGIGYEWSGLSRQERESGAQAPILYALSVLVVFLFLAALYESWSVPFAVMLVVPLGILGAVLFALARELSNDIYFQVGLLTTIGLSARNAILIVEFAKTLYEQGMSLTDATLEAVRIRLRPIAMTALTFMLGVAPLMLATGAGSGAQNAIGTAVFGGMLGATTLAIFFIPVFFVMVLTVTLKLTGRSPHKTQPAAGDMA